MGHKNTKGISPVIFSPELVLANKLAGLLRGAQFTFTEEEFSIIGYNPKHIVHLISTKNYVIWKYVSILREKQELLTPIPQVIREHYFRPIAPPKKREWFQEYIHDSNQILDLDKYDFVEGHYTDNVLIECLPKLPRHRILDLERRFGFYRWKEWLIVKSYLQSN